MKMEVIAVQQQYQTQFSGLGSNKYRDWTSTLTPPLSAIVNMNTNSSTTTTTATTPAMSIKSVTANSNNNNNSGSNNANLNASSRTPYQLHHHHHHNNNSSGSGSSHNINNNNINNNNNNINNHLNHGHRQLTNTTNKMKNSINNKKASRQTTNSTGGSSVNVNTTTTNSNSNNFYYCDNNDIIDVAAVNELSLRLLDELRAAKSRHLTCTEVSLPCDLTPSIAAEIIRVSEKEPCGIRGCTIYIEFEDEPNNSRRIASLKLDPETVSTFEVYLTLRQDHRGWASLLPQFMKSLARTITISPEFTITKHKLYSPTQQRLSYTTNTTATTTSSGTTAAISTPSS